MYEMSVFDIILNAVDDVRVDQSSENYTPKTATLRYVDVLRSCGRIKKKTPNFTSLNLKNVFELF